MKMKKLFAVAMATVMMLLSFSGCKGDAAGADEEDTVKQTNEKLVLWDLYQNEYVSDGVTYEPAINSFKSKFPDVELIIEKKVLNVEQQEDLDSFAQMQEEITGVYMRYPADREFYKRFEPYFKGEKSYEECKADVQSWIEIYLSE